MHEAHNSRTLVSRTCSNPQLSLQRCSGKSTGAS